KSQGLAQPRDWNTVHLHSLSLRGAIETDADLRRTGARHRSAQHERLGPESDDVDVTRAADAAQQLEVVDRFQKIRFSVAVVADEHHTRLGERQIDVREV